MPAETKLGSYSITKPSSHMCRIYPQLKDHLPALWGNAAPDCDVDWVVCDQWSVREDQGGWAVTRLTVREEFGVRNGEKCAAEGGDSQCRSSSGWTWRKWGESSTICISPMCLLVELQSFMPYRTLCFIRTEITNATVWKCNVHWLHFPQCISIFCSTKWRQPDSSSSFPVVTSQVELKKIPRNYPKKSMQKEQKVWLNMCVCVYMHIYI